MSRLMKMIDDKEFYHLYQPLHYLLSGEKCGYELLFRSRAYSSPECTFKHAKENDLLYELDTASIQNAIFSNNAIVRFLDESLFMFINVFPVTLVHPSFPAFLSRLLEKLPVYFKGRIVLEIIESKRSMSMSQLQDIVEMLKDIGFLIAIDDVGKEASSLVDMIELSPNMVKLDSYFSKNLASDQKKQALIRALTDYCRSSGSQIVLEGIENPEDLSAAKELGVDIGQGYIFGKPKKIF